MLTLPVIGCFAGSAETRQYKQSIEIARIYPVEDARCFAQWVVNANPLSGSSPLTADIMQKEP